MTWDDYYPYGKRMAQRTQNIGDDNDDTKYTGYQYEDEGDLNLYHAGARLYDPELGRFLSIDRFHSKTPSFTPYQYAANNPISFIDVNGDSIDVSRLSKEEQNFLINSLARITGYHVGQFNISNGKLSISKTAKTKDGTELAYTAPVGGSTTARHFMNILIRFDKTEHQSGKDFELKSGAASKADGTLNYDRPTAHNVDPGAWDVGMSFFHEGYHFTRFFNFNSDSYATMLNTYGNDNRTDPARGTREFRQGNTGPTVDFVNRIRSELGYNERTSYRGFTLGGIEYTPFDAASRSYLKSGTRPPGGSSYFSN